MEEELASKTVIFKTTNLKTAEQEMRYTDAINFGKKKTDFSGYQPTDKQFNFFNKG